MRDRSEHDVLKYLIETCRDAARGFRESAARVHDPSAKKLFLDLASERLQFVEALMPHAQRLGGDAPAAGTSAGALHRGWMTVKDTLSRHDDQAIIAEVVRGDAAGMRAFKEAVEGLLPPDARDVIERQLHTWTTGHDRILALRRGGPVVL